MTLFTEGRLQAYERMMQDTGRHSRNPVDDQCGKAGQKPGRKKTGKAGETDASVQSRKER